MFIRSFLLVATGVCIQLSLTTSSWAACANTTLTVTNVSGQIGATINLTATLKQGSSGVSGKTITFKVNGSTVGTASTNSSGVATRSYTVSTSFSTGSKTIDCTWAGDSSFCASSGSGTLTVQKANITITVTNLSGQIGQTVTLQATLKRATDNAVLSSKTLSFTVSSSSAGSDSTDSSGIATRSYTIPETSTGGKTISVDFSGDSQHNSGSGNGTLTVSKANVSITVVSLSGQIGQSVTLQATLRRATDNSPLSGETISFSVGGSSAGSDSTDSSGIATRTYTIPETSTGNKTITASYSGDSYDNSGSGTGTLTVSKADVLITVTNLTGQVGQTVTLQATLRRATTNELLTSEYVYFYVGGSSVGSDYTDFNGVATHTYTIPETSPGNRTITVEYSGSSYDSDGTGTGTLTVQKANTSITIPNRSGSFGQTVTLMGTLKRTSDNELLDGESLSFKIGTSTVGSDFTDFDGEAEEDYDITDSDSAGTKTITVTYSGDTYHNSSTGTATLTISKANTALAVTNLSGAYGQTVTLRATLTRTTDGEDLSSKTITFKINGSTVGTASTSYYGVATRSYTIPQSLATGSNTITASFAGDSRYNASTGTGTLTVSKGNTYLSVASTSGAEGESVALQTTLRQSANGYSLSGRTVQFFIDGNPAGSGVTGFYGTATSSYMIPAGSGSGFRSILAQFAGDTYYNASSGYGTLTVTNPAGAALRLFLSTDGLSTPANTNSPAVRPPSQAPPTVETSGGPQRLYLWAQMSGAPTPQVWSVITLNLALTGAATIADWNVWNYANGGYTRWLIANRGTLDGPAQHVTGISFIASPPGTLGVNNDPASVPVDGQYDATTDSTLLGYIDVQGAGEIFVGIGNGGILRHGAGNELVYLGYGDEADGLLGNSYNQYSTLSEATATYNPPDTDSDGLIDMNDNCPNEINPGQEDADADGAGDPCDNCPGLTNVGQADSDSDGFGDACDACPGYDDREDCNGDGIADGCDVLGGTSADCDNDHIPDECQTAADCNSNGFPDGCEVAAGTSKDINANHIPDDCEEVAAVVLTFDHGSRAAADCIQPGSGTNEILTVRIQLRDSSVPVTGGQYFMEYDTATVDFLSAIAGDPPFTREVYEVVNESAGTLTYATGIENTGTATSADRTLAILTFRVVAESCATTALLRFTDHEPPTRLSDSHDGEVQSVLTDLQAITTDFTSPIITLPANISVHSDAGECQATFTTLALATATDNCDTNVAIAFLRSDGKPGFLDPYAAVDSPITITWFATDDCGNTASAVQAISVSAENEMRVDVELSPTLDDPNPTDGDLLTRCLRFELWGCPAGVAPAATVDHVISFPVDAGFPHLVSNVPVLVPCGAYNCVTVRDRLHTLRSTAPSLVDQGTTYAAAVVGNRGAGGHWLINGNVNDDRFVDILDFGSFIVRFQTNYGVGDTTCATPFFHVDISGDGLVFTGDFTFIQVNFLKRNESNCCGRTGLAGDDQDEPVRSISVAELWRSGLGDLAAADLNADGTLDERDMREFAANGLPMHTNAPISRTISEEQFSPSSKGMNVNSRR